MTYAINPGTRLKNARDKLDLTLQEVAKQMGFEHYQIISNIESGKREVKAWELAKLARIYHRDFNYFLEEGSKDEKEPVIIWRNQTMKNKETERRFIHYCENYEKIEKIVEARHEKLNTLRGDQEEIAEFTKDPDNKIEELASGYLDNLKLGRRPACVLPKILEETQGVKLFYTDKITGSAASTINDFFGAAVLLNADNVPWRRNYDLAHELFHLITWEVFHKERKNTGVETKTIEQWAERFGASILMPGEEVRKEFKKRLVNNKISSPSLVELAIEFGVSIQALIIRLRELKLLESKEVADKLNKYQELKAIDNRAGEQDENKPRLSQRFINLAIKAFLLGRISKGKLAEYLEIPFSEVSTLLLKHGYDENKNYSHEFTAT